MNDMIDFIDEKGNLFIDTILKPLAKGSKNILIDDNKIVKSFLTFKTAFIENKLSQFIEFINQNQEHEIIDFIENLSSEEKTFFIETLNKVIDLDDSLQIFILTQLTTSYQKNKTLNYWEKSLFYNIKQVSEDDFINLYTLMENLQKPIIYKKSYALPKKIFQDELILSLRKFENLGILNINNSSFQSEVVNSKDNISGFNFSLYAYSNDLYEMVRKYNEIIINKDNKDNKDKRDRYN